MAYELGTKEDYVEGNMRAYDRVHSLVRHLDVVQLELKSAIELARGHTWQPELKAILTLVKCVERHHMTQWLETLDNMRAAQGHMWEYHKAREVNALAGERERTK